MKLNRAIELLEKSKHCCEHGVTRPLCVAGSCGDKCPYFVTSEEIIEAISVVVAAYKEGKLNGN